jgi:hypothetical protein
MISGLAMKNRYRRYAAILLGAAACLAQETGTPPQYSRPSESRSGEDVRFPNGKSQKDEILKAEYAQNLKDARELVTLSRELRDSLEKNDRYVLSLADLKKTDDIEKLVKKIRSRLLRN